MRKHTFLLTLLLAVLTVAFLTVFGGLVYQLALVQMANECVESYAK